MDAENEMNNDTEQYPRPVIVDIDISGPHTPSNQPLPPKIRAELLKVRRLLGLPPLPEELESSPAPELKDRAE